MARYGEYRAASRALNRKIAAGPRCGGIGYHNVECLLVQP